MYPICNFEKYAGAKFVTIIIIGMSYTHAQVSLFTNCVYFSPCSCKFTTYIQFPRLFSAAFGIMYCEFVSQSGVTWAEEFDCLFVRLFFDFENSRRGFKRSERPGLLLDATSLTLLLVYLNEIRRNYSSKNLEKKSSPSRKKTFLPTCSPTSLDSVQEDTVPGPEGRRTVGCDVGAVCATGPVTRGAKLLVIVVWKDCWGIWVVLGSCICVETILMNKKIIKQI